MLDKIIIKNAKVHNLKNVSLEFPKNKLIVFTGVSGSGKSSLAFDTIYAEGQRKYVESLSSYARQFLGLMEKPDVEYIEGLSPAISIDQKTTGHNPRSTVGTITEIYDYLRLLFARIGTAYDPITGEKLESQTIPEIYQRIIEIPTLYKLEKVKVNILAPLVRNRKGTYEELFQKLLSQGFVRVRVNGNIMELDQEIKLDRFKTHNIELVVDRIILGKDVTISEDQRKRIIDSLELSLNKGESQIIVNMIDQEKDIVYSENLVMSDGTAFPKLEPNLFSFNSPIGACGNCNGLGFISEIDPDLVYNPRLTVAEGAIYPWSRNWDMAGGWYKTILEEVAKKFKINLKIPMGELPKDKLKIVLYGIEDETFKVKMESGNVFNGKYEGIIPNLQRRYKETESETLREELSEYFREQKCPICAGARLNKYALAVKISEKNILDITDMNIDDALNWIIDLES